MTKAVVTLMVATAMLALSVTAVATPRAPDLRGTWQCRGNQGAAVALHFKRHNRLLYNGEAGSYSLLPGVILVRDVFGPVEYRYQLDGDQLRIRSPGGTDLQCWRDIPGQPHPATAAANDAALAQLHARLCSWSSPSSYSSSYSHSSWLAFDGRGRVRYGSDSVFSSGADLAHGDADTSVGGSYRIVGNTVEIALDDGTSTRGRIRKREQGGDITELVINDNLFSATECQ